MSAVATRFVAAEVRHFALNRARAQAHSAALITVVTYEGFLHAGGPVLVEVVDSMVAVDSMAVVGVVDQHTREQSE
jgi:hypothetical protein